jgi:short-subunit dehydrogenase
MDNELPHASEPPLLSRPRAIVIGASSGIGAAVAQRLAREGFQVALVARRKPALDRLCGQINEERGAQVASAYPHDVSNLAEVPGLFQTILRDLHGVDLVLFSAGAMPNVGLDEFSPEKDQAMVNVNLNGAMAWLGQAAALFSKMGSGHIIAISSVAGDRGRVKNPGYNASKAGLDAYMEGLRNRLTRKGVHVLTVKPGFVNTAMLAGADRTFWVISPDQAAEGVWQAIKRRRQLVYIPGRWRWLMMIIRNIPSFIFRRLSF